MKVLPRTWWERGRFEGSKDGESGFRWLLESGCRALGRGHSKQKHTLITFTVYPDSVPRILSELFTCANLFYSDRPLRAMPLLPTFCRQVN